ncbi:MAG: mechanosensitive ion channel family protein [Bacilli bacterium]|jgi:small-conductance mechanosensitive channel
MEKEKKSCRCKDKRFISKAIFFAICGLFVLFVLLAPLIFGETSYLGASLDALNSIGLFFKNRFPTLITTLLLIIVILGLSKILRFLLSLLEKRLTRRKSVLDLVKSLIKYLAVIVLIIWILKLWGVDTAALIASVGILGLIIGLGAQPLIEDVISGLFIVFEQNFDVGDVVVIDGFRGTVQEIGVRTTKIIDVGGDIQVINNSDIRRMINMTSDLSLAICDVAIEYGESLERVEKVISENLERIKNRLPSIVEGPFYKGVSKLADKGVFIRLIARCDENDRYQLVRDLNREIKLIFDENKIYIALPQIIVNEPQTFEAKGVRKGSTNVFVDEQKELSKHIMDDDK